MRGFDALSLDPDILNAGLSLAMEWGEDWLKPIQDRLKIQYPGLSRSQLNAYNKRCQLVIKRGTKQAGSCMKFGKDPQRFEQERDSFYREFRGKYAWISDENLGRIFSQGCYYAMK